MKRSELSQLRMANPVPIERAGALAEELELHARLLAMRERRDGASALSGDEAQRRRGLPAVWLLAAAAAILAAVLAATPAVALIRDALPFWSSPKAPPAVALEFASMNTGAPAGMSPQAVAAETREIGRFRFGGGVHTLWVAPAKAGGFCFEWIGGWGGCDTAITAPLTWNGDLVLPAGVAQPAVPPGTSSQATAEAMRKGHDLAVPRWISGYVDAASVRSVAIKFSDGSVVQPQITWVSEPIDAGFFAYDIPEAQQTESDHLVTVDALDPGGRLVAEQPLH